MNDADVELTETEEQEALRVALSNGVSAKQVNFLTRLVREHVTPEWSGDPDERVQQLRLLLKNGELTRRNVSREIDFWLGRDRAPVITVASGERLTPGVYELDGRVYVVKPNRVGDRLYAKRLTELQGGRRLTETGDHVAFEFTYAPGAVQQLRPEHRMPLDRAKELTLRYGRCINCNRKLKAAVSVERGIGPVCIKAFAVVGGDAK